MTRATVLKYEFVDHIPATLKDGVIYVCIPYATAVHKCCCGCGNEVVTPITPTDWELTFDGETVSMHPSVGSWNLPCQSHYFIRRNIVRWVRRWSREEIAAGRAREQHAKDEYFEAGKKEAPPKKSKRDRSLWGKLKSRFSKE